MFFNDTEKEEEEKWSLLELIKSISSKKAFFDSFKDRYYKNDIFSFLIVKLDEKSREVSNSDYLAFFWVKTCNPKSKKLLKKIKQSNTI